MSDSKLRLALTILSIGFALEGTAELYSYLTPGATVPAASGLFFLPLLLAFAGLAFIWVGRDEWVTAHPRRARTASGILAASFTAGFVCAGLLVVLLAFPSLGVPWWATWTFGVAAAGLVFGTLALYGYFLFHLVSRPVKGAVVAALVWSLVISAAIGVVFANNLGTVLALVANRSLGVPSFIEGVDGLLSYLFATFFLLLAAAIEAHIGIVRGRLATGARQPST